MLTDGQRIDSVPSGSQWQTYTFHKQDFPIARTSAGLAYQGLRRKRGRGGRAGGVFRVGPPAPDASEALACGGTVQTACDTNSD